MEKETIKIVIDNRELNSHTYSAGLRLFFEPSSVMENFPDNKKNVVVEYSNLDIGDYHFYYNNELVLLIERKTINDLAASIKDGRHREQKSRLETMDKSKIIMLIEGSINKPNDSIKYNRVEPYTIISSIYNTMLRDNFHVLHTSNIEETIFCLFNFVKKLYKTGLDFMKIEDKPTMEENLIATMKLKKKDNITKDTFSISALSCIPGVSNKIASELIGKYSNITNLLAEITTQDNPKDFLTNLTINTETGKTRKLGKVGITIGEFLGCF